MVIKKNITKKIIILILLVFFVSFLFSKYFDASQKKQIVASINPPSKDSIIKPLKLNDTVIIKYYKKLKVPVTIKYAKNAIGTILVLPGWNFPDTQWCEKTLLCEKALKMNYNLLFIEMQRSVYLKEYYPQTRKDYKNYPTRTWLIDSVLKVLQDKYLIYPKGFNFAIGLSTGGRGAAILGLDYPSYFKAVASLSGDFDPTLQKNDNLMVFSLGPYNNNIKLWEGSDNMAKRAKEMKTPIYIGHGMIDKTCPIIQSTNFVKELKKQNPSLIIKTNFPKNMGHDYTYWNSEVDSVIAFFNQFK